MTEQEFKEIYETYSTMVLLRAFKSLPTQDAEDIVVELFVKMWKLQPHFEGEGQLVNYLIKSVDRLIINKARNNKAHLQKRKIVFNSQQHIEYPPEVSDLMELLLREVEKLAPVRKEVFKIWLSGEQDYEKIGEILNMKADTVRSHIRHSREAILKAAKKANITKIGSKKV